MSRQIKTAKVFTGTIVHSTSQAEICLLNGFIAIESGKITASLESYAKFATENNLDTFEVINLPKHQFLVPGFVDCHVHAPQFPNLGIGLDKPLLEWLAAYTFPLEKQYENISFASRVYKNVVSRLLKNGTTTACYFGSLHLEGTLELAKIAIQLHQRAFVGKVSMNIKNDARYYNSTEKEVEDTDAFINAVIDLKSDLVEPIITPRFAISCDANIMRQLGSLADKYKCHIQSHISENRSEIHLIKELYPDCNNYADVYDKAGLLTDKCIMAHAVHLTDDEISLLLQRGVSVGHCPASNTRLSSGMCPVRKLLNHGITIGLGTDVSGGDSTNILDAIRRTIDVSTHLTMLGGTGPAITMTEAFYLATLGGAKALNLDHKIGNFEIGKEFDALVVDVYCDDSQIDRFEESPESYTEKYATELLQRFLYLGDDRNVIKVYVQGQEVKYGI